MALLDFLKTSTFRKSGKATQRPDSSTTSSTSEMETTTVPITTEKERASLDEARRNELNRITTEDINAERINYPTGIKLVLIMASLMMAVFLVALDQTIIATAIPKITDDFGSITDIGWYGSAYLLTATAFQPLYGKIYTIFNVGHTHHKPWKSTNK